MIITKETTSMRKKTLLLAVALALAAGAGHAQSSVTVFGIVDLSLRVMKNGGSSVKQVGTDGIAPSRIGFRGTEDLGGGLSAGFWLESGLQPDNGTTTSAAKFWNRRTTVSLNGPWGEVRLGRDYDPTFWNINQFDPFNGLLFGQPLNLFSTLGSGATTLLRTDNAMQYFLPRDLGGWYGQLSAAAGEGSNGTKYVGGRVGYQRGAFNGAVAVGRTSGLGDEDFRVINLGASYDFGFLKLMGYANRSRYLVRKQEIWLLGTSFPVGVHEFRVNYARANASGGGTDGNDASQWALGYVHNLSKRTALYATVARTNNDGNAAFVLATPPAAAVGKASRGVDLGIRHSF